MAESNGTDKVLATLAILGKLATVGLDVACDIGKTMACEGSKVVGGVTEVVSDVVKKRNNIDDE
ncbi:MAG: hypothetical protein KDD21_01545 [Bacteroidetes bacterium]|nr:hypothetical protein [Bacteroidota bacterium]